MILATYFIDNQNNYSIKLDTETGLFGATYRINGTCIKDKYPLGTTRKEVETLFKVLFKEKRWPKP